MHIIKDKNVTAETNCKEYRFYEQKVTESVRKEKKMNYDKSNIPLMRMGDIRKTLKRTFKVRPGRKIKLKARVRDDGNSTRIIYHTATVIKLYPYVVQLQLENGQYTSPGYTKLYLMFHGADEK